MDEKQNPVEDTNVIALFISSYYIYNVQSCDGLCLNVDYYCLAYAKCYLLHLYALLQTITDAAQLIAIIDPTADK